LASATASRRLHVLVEQEERTTPRPGTRGYERLGAAPACCERYRSIGVWDGEMKFLNVEQLGALVGGRLENLKVAL